MRVGSARVAHRALAAAIALNLGAGLTIAVSHSEPGRAVSTEGTGGSRAGSGDGWGTWDAPEPSEAAPAEGQPSTTVTTAAPGGSPPADAPPSPSAPTTTAVPPPHPPAPPRGCPTLERRPVSGYVGQGLYAARPDGTGLALLAPDAFAAGISPDGDRILFATSHVWCLGPTAGGRSSEVPGLLPIAAGQDGSVAWSPDGGRVAFVRYRSDNDPQGEFRTEVAIRDLRSGSTTVLAPRGTRRALAVDWSADGRLVIAADGRIEVLEADGSGLRTVCQRRSWLLGEVQWVRSTSRVLAIDGDGALVSVDTDSGSCSTIGTGGAAFSFDFRPDGSGVYTPGSRLTVRSSSGSERTVTRTSAETGRWVGTSQRLAFLHVDESGWAVRLVGADGAGERTVLKTPPVASCVATLGDPITDPGGTVILISTLPMGCLP